MLAFLLALLLVAGSVQLTLRSPGLPAWLLSKRMLLLAGTIIVLVLWAGTYALFDNYPLTRDEQMVLFDTQVFRSLQLAAPVPQEWRSFLSALNPAFLLALPDNAAWVSSYMPMNGMLRAAFGTVADPALMNPLLAGLGAFALFDVTGRLFPEDQKAQLLALLLYATSTQILVTAMTTYAMTAHLALNLIWLCLYLRGTWRGHALALCVGFVAIGLHQIVFHPLFALPFINRLRQQRQWRAALVYVGAYAIFGLFWISYPQIVASSAGLSGGAAATAAPGSFLAERVLPLLKDREPQTIPLMVANLLRFVAWQNLALIPLMGLGVRAVRRDEGIARPLAYGVGFTFVAMAILLPYQGHGWGYRYLHGLIGNCILLALYGWRELRIVEQRRAFVWAGTLATFVSMPFLMWQAHAFAHPYARVNRAIDRINVDMVVVETDGPEFRIDEVRNRPDLLNRPIRLASSALNDGDIQSLCERGTIAFLDAKQMRALGQGFGPARVSPQFRSLQVVAKKSRCRLL